MQRVYFVAAVAPLLAALFFGGGSGAEGSGSTLACSVVPGQAAGAPAANASPGGDAGRSGSYGY